MKRNLLMAVTAVVALGFNARADTIILKDGQRFNGRFISGSESSITFQVERGMRRTFHTSSVQSLQFDNSGRVPSRSSIPERDSGTSATGMRTDEASGLGSGPLIPAGTALSVRTNEAIHADQATEGRSYSGTVDRDVMDANGELLVPRGSAAELVVRSASDNDVTVDVQSLQVHGQRYLVSSQGVTRSGNQGLGKNRRTGEYVGGGAVLGSILGAIAGGGRGAAIGAAAGAAAGAGAQVLTRGKEVNIPAETVLTFKLDQGVRLVRR